jgi:hypothetical protein
MNQRSEITQPKGNANPPTKKKRNQIETDLRRQNGWRENAGAASVGGRAARSAVITLLALMTAASAGLALYSSERVNMGVLFKTEGRSANEDARPAPRIDRRSTESAPPSQKLAANQRTEQYRPAPDSEASSPKPQPELNQNTISDQSHSPPVTTVRQPPIKDPPERKQPLRVEVQKAIKNRAIEGVSVQVADRTVYLQGRVATERQKALAEKAALSVHDTLRVQNQIVVENSD